jgi:hypothetical protein
MISELRIYNIYPEKMKDINDRFANHTLSIFSRLGMNVTGFWQNIDKNKNQIYYLLEFPDMAARHEKFKKFRNDPEWNKVKAESEKDGPIVESVESVFLEQAPYFKFQTT